MTFVSLFYACYFNYFFLADLNDIQVLSLFLMIVTPTTRMKIVIMEIHNIKIRYIHSIYQKRNMNIVSAVFVRA